jgi:glucose-1-phosphatase
MPNATRPGMRDRRVILFDLGGVLVESSGQAALRELLPDASHAEILARWLASQSVGLFERGSIPPEVFADRFVEEWQLPLTSTEFLEIFSSWVRGFYPGAKPLVEGLRTRHTVGCLSNTNAVHWARLADIQTAFDFCIASHLTGHMKPDRIAYEHALKRLNVLACEVYFFDDLVPNVVAARSVGINAFHVRGLAETEAALRSLGLARDSDALR